jgi:hypothetical protein
MNVIFAELLIPFIMRTRTFRYRFSPNPASVLLLVLPVLSVLRFVHPFINIKWFTDVIIPANQVFLGLAGLAGIIFIITWLSSGSTEM